MNAYTRKFKKLLMCFTSIMCVPSHCSFKKEPAIAIVGAGIAGLTAAYRLFQKGFDVQVYEARGRVGGRILSAFINGEIAELGGENLADGGDCDNLYPLLEELELELTHITIPPINRFFCQENKVIPDYKLAEQFSNEDQDLEKKLQDIKSSARSMHDVLTQIMDPEGTLYTFLNTCLASYEGAAVEQLSSFYVETLYYMLNGGVCTAHQGNGLYVTRLKDGNSILTERLAQKLGNRVHLNMALTFLSKKRNRYVLTFNDTTKVTADIVVLALPCPVYNDITFGKKTIPEGRLHAIRSIRNGNNAKIIVPLAKERVTSTLFVDDQLVIFSFYPTMLTCYFTRMLSNFDVNTIAYTYAQAQPLLNCACDKAIIPQQKPLYADDKVFAYYTSPVGYSWPNDHWAQGTYSYVGVGQDTLWSDVYEDHGLIIKKLFTPIDDQIYFAGEHTSTLFDVPGTIEAACQSGNVVAAMIERVVKA